MAQCTSRQTAHQISDQRVADTKESTTESTSQQMAEENGISAPLTRQQRKAKGLDILPQKSQSQEDREATEARRAAKSAKKMLEKQIEPSTSVPASTLRVSEEDMLGEEERLVKLRRMLAGKKSKKDRKKDEKAYVAKMSKTN